MNNLPPANILKLLVKPLDKKILQKTTEQWASSFWSATRERRKSSKQKFTMMLPPPNITGNLHLGHALTVSIQDALIRQRRMLGYDCEWIPGFDHAGLATQSIVERVIWAKSKMTRLQLGREKFIESANDWKSLKQDQMRNQLNRLGLELDWDKEYFTMDTKSSLSVQEAFRRLFRKGVIYRGERPVYWSNELQSTLSDIEVEKVDGVVRYNRTGEQLEIKTLPQWYISADEMACRADDVVKDGSIQVIPQNYKTVWTNWLTKNGIQDWCISRQSWWGHRIPAYKNKSTADTRESWVVAESVEEASELLQCKAVDIVQDPDVLDTWFSSSLLTLTISGWPKADEFDKALSTRRYPLDIMETGFDILNYWVSKMVMVSLALEDKIPFKLILLHGMICDSNGKKMSKSRGNIIDPLDIIDGASLEELQARTNEFHKQGIMDDKQLELAINNQSKLFPQGIPECGADGLRAYLLSHDFQEEVVRIQIQQIEKIRRLTNKIWNVYRYVLNLLQQVKDHKIRFEKDLLDITTTNLTDGDLKILGEMARCVKSTNDSFERGFDFHVPVNELEHLWTIHLSTDYLTHARPILVNQENTGSRIEKLELLIKLIVTATKLSHPFMPHLTEFLYQKLYLQMHSLDESCDISKLCKLSETQFPTIKEWEPYFVADYVGGEVV